MARRVALAAQGADPSLRRRSGRLAGRWLSHRDALSAGMVDHVLASAAAFADSVAFEKLREAALSATDRAERTRLLQALMLARDPALRERAYELVRDKRVNGRDALAMLNKALSDETVRTWAFAFLRKNYDAIVARIPPDAAGNLIGALSGA
jgi:alanyl aminopeptidase